MAYEQEQLNYFRLCNVVFNLVPVRLRQIFKQEWDFLYKKTLRGEWKDSPQNGRDFYNKESKASRKRNARCLTIIQNGDTAEWDCTCLFFAILYSDSIGTTLSPAVYKDVDDIRQVRNHIAHIKDAKVTDSDFQTSVDRVLSALISLSLPITEIQEIKKQKTFPTEELENIKKQASDLQAELDQTKSDLQEKQSRLQSTEADLVSAREENKALTQEISAKLQPFCILTSSPPHKIIRRLHDIERITNKMEELYGGANGAISTVYLSGNPGCGKSQLAREIGQEFFPKRTGELSFVATLNAESVDTLAESYLNLGRRVGITEYTLTSLENLKREKPGEAIGQLHRLIKSKVSTFTKWLIIADNVVVLRSVQGFLPQTGSKEWGHGQVLITTQDSSTIPYNDAPYTYHESLSKGMKQAEAMKLLENVSQVIDQDQVKAVVKALDYQPLALAAAAYYMQTVVNSASSNYDWTKYLHEILTYEKRKTIENLLASENSAYPKTTLAAVEMALRRVIKNDKVLREAFFLFVICARVDLPLEAVSKFVMAKLKHQSEELIKAAIKRSSLILVSSEEGSEQTYLHLHNIVHAVLKEGQIFNLNSRENDHHWHDMVEMVKIFQGLMEANRKDYAFLKKLMPHCRSLLQYITSDFTSDEGTIFKMLSPLIDIAIVVDWLRTVSCVCLAFYHTSFAKKSVDLARTLLKYLRESDSNTSTIKGRIFSLSGAVYRLMGEYHKAKEFHEEELNIRKKIFDKEPANVQRNVAASYNNLASVYLCTGDVVQAKKFHEKALEIQKTVLEENHADMAYTYSNLASVCEKIETENEQAKEFHEKALLILKKNFGEDHAFVAGSYENLASVYNKIGRHDEAEELCKQARTIWKKIFGEDDVRVAVLPFWHQCTRRS